MTTHAYHPCVTGILYRQTLIYWRASTHPHTHTHLFNVLVLIDTGCEGRGEAFVDVWLGCQLLQGLHSVFGEQLLFRVLVQAVQALLVRLPEVDGVDVSLVHGLHVALDGAHAHGDCSVDTCGDIREAVRMLNCKWKHGLISKSSKEAISVGKKKNKLIANN